MHSLKLERQRRGLTQTQLSALTGIASTDISAIERGIKAAFPGWRRRLAQALGVSADELFDPGTGTNDHK